MKCIKCQTTMEHINSYYYKSKGSQDNEWVCPNMYCGITYCKEVIRHGKTIKTYWEDTNIYESNRGENNEEKRN